MTPAVIDQLWMVTNEVVEVVFNTKKIIKHDEFPPELPVKLPPHKNGMIENPSSCPLPQTPSVGTLQTHQTVCSSLTANTTFAVSV